MGLDFRDGALTSSHAAPRLRTGPRPHRRYALLARYRTQRQRRSRTATPALSRLNASPPDPRAWVEDHRTMTGAAVPGSPRQHRREHLLARPAPLDRARMARLPIGVGVPLPIPRPRVGAAAATHPLVAALDRPRLLPRGIVEDVRPSRCPLRAPASEQSRRSLGPPGRGSGARVARRRRRSLTRGLSSTLGLLLRSTGSVEVRLGRRWRAAEPRGDLGDRESLCLPIVPGTRTPPARRRSATRSTTDHPSPPRWLFAEVVAPARHRHAARPATRTFRGST